MIIPDINVLLYTYDRDSPFHDSARRWWESLLGGSERVGISWIVASGFVRLATSPTIVVRTISVESAIDIVEDWFTYPNVSPLNPGERHLSLFRQALQSVGGGRNRVTDAHLAALAIGYDAELHTNDNGLSPLSRPALAESASIGNARLILCLVGRLWQVDFYLDHCRDGRGPPLFLICGVARILCR